MTALEDLRNRIIDRVPLDLLVNERVNLTERSGHKIGTCPFHQEKTPSFYVYTQSPAHYHCYGCGAHGDAISWVRLHQGLAYVETLRYLAGKYSIDAPELNDGRSERQQLAGLYRMMNAAQTFFAHNLSQERAAPIREYLVGRGFSPTAQESFGFGLALDAPAALLDTLRSQGFQDAQLLSCSLTRISERTKRPYDFFRHRITVPIHDRDGRLIAFGGRAIGDGQPKYLNPASTEIFDKSRTLYGLDKARDSIRRKGRVLIAEGYMDVLQLWNHGFTEAVACMGTALTEGQLRLLAGSCRTVYLVFDSDQAGKAANLKAVKHMLAIPQLQAKVVLLPDSSKEDPDSYLQRLGADAFSELLASAPDLLEYAITSRLDVSSGMEVAELIRQEFAPWLLSVTDLIQRALLMQQIAQRTGVPAALLDQLVAELRGGPKPLPAAKVVAPAPPARELRPLDSLEFDLIGHLYFATPQELNLSAIEDFITLQLEWDGIWLELASEFIGLLKAGQKPRDIGMASFMATIQGGPPLAVLAELEDKAPAFEHSQRQDAIHRLIKVKKTRQLKGQIQTLRRDLGRDGENQRSILQAITKLTQEIAQMDR